MEESSEQPSRVLNHWFAGGASIRPINVGRGFSGAKHWQVEHAKRLFVLRQWPEGGVDASSLKSIHELQVMLADKGLPVPSPVKSRSGVTFLSVENRYWELSPWMPGVADYWQDPRPAKLAAALETLARIHLAVPETPEICGAIFGYHLAVEERIRKLRLLAEKDLRSIREKVSSGAGGDETARARVALELAHRALPIELEKARFWEKERLPVRTCVRDIWHDHILFTGDRVTGVIDFGGADLGSPSADIARLLGSLVGDDATRWQAGLAAYQSVRPLSQMERGAVGFFDSTGVLLSTVNWVRWLYAEPPNKWAATFNRQAGLERFEKLVERLAVLAESRRT